MSSRENETTGILCLPDDDMRGKAQFCVSSKEVRFNKARLQKKLSSQPLLNVATCPEVPM